MKIHGSRSLGRTQVFVDGKELKPHASQKVLNHSPDGFEWGYSGSGPAQLSLAILLHAGASKERAVEMHQNLKAQVIAGLGYDFDIELEVRPDGTWGRPTPASSH